MAPLARATRALTTLAVSGALALTGALTGALPAQAAGAVTPPSAPVPNYDDGLFGVPDVFSAAYKQAAALLAISTLDDSQVSPADEDAVSAGISWLIAQQCANGGWQGYKISDVDCGPLSTDFSNSLAYVAPDSNTTALVVQAFAAFGLETETAPQDGLDFLRSLQNADGGFEFSAGSGSDPNSTALAIQAFLAAGTDPATLTKGSNTPYSYLQALQLDCSAVDPADQGGIQAPFALGSANMFATLQSVPALAGVSYPVYQDVTPTAGGTHLECPTALLKAKRGAASTATSANTATATATAPSAAPSGEPSSQPTTAASGEPTGEPSTQPSSEPTAEATAAPTTSESGSPAASPTESASAQPSQNPAASPAAKPAAAPLARRPASRPVTAHPALAAATPAAAAALAATWVADNLSADGSVDSGFVVDFSGTAYAVMGFAATGTNGTALTKALGFLQTHLSGATTKSGADEVGGLSLTALAAVAGNADPTAFGGSDLISRIEALQYFTPEVPTVPSVTPTDSTDDGGTVGVGGSGSSAGGGLPFTGLSTDSFASLALLIMLLGGALVGAGQLRAPMRGRHAA